MRADADAFETREEARDYLLLLVEGSPSYGYTISPDAVHPAFGEPFSYAMYRCGDGGAIDGIWIGPRDFLADIAAGMGVAKDPDARITLIVPTKDN